MSAPPGGLEQRRPRQSSSVLLSPGRTATWSSWCRQMGVRSLMAKWKRGDRDSATANKWEPLEFQLMTYSTGEKTNIIKKINSTTHSCSAELLGQKKKKLAGQEGSFWEGCNNISRFIAPSAFSEPVSKSLTGNSRFSLRLNSSENSQGCIQPPSPGWGGGRHCC